MIALLCLVATLSTTSPQATPTPQRLPPRDSTTEKKGTAAIKGKITAADTGRPLRRAQIRISASEMTPARSTSTNLQGMYEFRELPAGRYTVTVSRNGHLQMQYGQRRPGEPPKPLQIADGQIVEKLDFALPRAGVISGRVTDETSDSIAGVQVWAMQPQFFQGRRRLVPISETTRTDDAGQFRLVGLAPGDYVVVAHFRETWTADGETKQVFSYAPSYFGGTQSAADAPRVKVGLGQEVPAIDITMLPVLAASVSGTALASDGTPLAGGNISLNSEVTGPNGGSYSGVGATTVAPDGSWKLRDVPPGEFQLTARSANRDKPTETAAMTLVVQGDMEGINLIADAGVTVSGRVVTDDGSPLPESRSLRVYAQTTVPGRRGVLVGDDNGIVRSDASFVLKGVSGPNMIQLQSVPRGWAVKSIDVGDKDYVDTPLEARGRDVEGVKVVLSHHFPGITGQIVDEKGNPAEGTVLLFPDDPSKWLESAGTLRTSRPDQSGTFRLETVRPGDYLAVALEVVQQWQVNDPEFLETLRDGATKLKLGEGTTERLTLKLRKPAQ